MTNENEEHELAQAFGCFLWIILIVCCCCSYYLGKHVGRTDLMNEMLIQRLQSESPMVPELKKETE